MTGSIYADHPEVLMQSFTTMNDAYASTSSAKGGLLAFLQKLYIRLFGIPEIGFQVRTMYFREAMHSIAAAHTPGRILDVGSGIGNYVYESLRIFPKAQVDGWEIDRKKLSFAKKFFKDKDITQGLFAYGDITKKPAKSGVYDLIVNIDVLEHIKDYKKALRHMHMLLAQGGHVYIHVPQVNQKRIFKQLESWEHEDHEREGFAPDAFRKDLEDIGFTVTDMRHTFGFPGSLAWELNHLLLKKSMILAGLAYPLLYFLSRVDTAVTNSSGLCMVVVARKKL